MDFLARLTKEIREEIARTKREIKSLEAPPPRVAVVAICREDNPRDVDEAYGEGTYRRLFPDEDE